MSGPRVVAAPLGSDLLDRIGDTPLLRIRLFEDELPGVTVLAKAEFMNPGGSVKDRPALRMIEQAEADGRLTRDRTILDSTSGNTGIAYAMVGAAKGYRVKLVMPSNVSAERKQLVAAYGAEVVYSDPMEGSDGAIRLCREILGADPGRYFMPDQYNNDDNWKAHYHGTAEEIWRQSEGRLTHFVASLGTSGTFVGCTRRLHELNPSIRCISVQPDNPWHGLEGLKYMETAIVPGIWDGSLADEEHWAPTEESYELAGLLAARQGVLVGHSSGANLWAAREVGREAQNAVIVTILCDGGARYLSGGLPK